MAITLHERCSVEIVLRGEIMAVPQERFRVAETTQVTPLESARISWAGVWSGFLIGLGVLMILSTLGLAVGISTADLGFSTWQGPALASA
jgi:hypothetical protein